MIQTRQEEMEQRALSGAATLMDEEPDIGGVESPNGSGREVPAIARRATGMTTLIRYASGFAAVAGALAFTLLLRPLFPYPFFFFFFPAVIGAAWFGGTGPGLFPVLVSTLAVDYFLTPPLYSLEVKATDLAYFAAFVACSLAVTWISSKKKERQDAL